MSSSEDDFEEELRKGFGHNISHLKKRRRTDVDGKERGMLGDFAEPSTTASHLRYQPVSFAGSSKPAAPSFTKAAPMFAKAGETPTTQAFHKAGENKPSMGSMNGAFNNAMGLGNKSEEAESSHPTMGSMNGAFNQFMGLGGKNNREDDTPKNTMGGAYNNFMGLGKQDPSDDETEDTRPGFGSSTMNQSNHSGFQSTPKNSWSKFDKVETPTSPPATKRHPRTHAHVGQSTYGIGAKMMANMGYVSGRGLGADGKGILNPVEHKLRPQGLGLGGIKEKTEQAKAEARRKGEVVSDDSDDDIVVGSARKSRVSGTQKAKEMAQKKAKDIYKTIHDIEAEGLHIPAGFKNIIDMTQGGQGATVDVGNLEHGVTTSEEESTDFQKTLDKARHDLTIYSKEWRALQSRKNYAQFETEQIKKKMDSVVDEITILDGVMKALEDLQVGEKSVESVTDVLETLQYQYVKEIKSLHLDEVAVAALTDPLVREMTNWDPLSDPTRFEQVFLRLKIILAIDAAPADEEEENEIPKDVYSYYDRFMYHIWLPKVKDAFRDTWKYTKPAMAILLIENWTSLLPKFILDDLLKMVVNTLLIPPLKHWKPASMSSRGSPSYAPHIWMFPWLPYIGEYMSTVRETIISRFGHLLRGWRITDGAPLEGILQWKEIIGEAEMETLLVRNLLPRLAHVLKRELDFVFKLSEDKVAGFKEIMKWHIAFKPSTFGVLLETAVFPLWQTAIYKILTGSKEPDLLELSHWYEMWYDAFPVSVRETPTVAYELHECLRLIEDAVDIPHSQRSKQLSKPRLMVLQPTLTDTLLRTERDSIKRSSPSGLATPQSKLPVATSTFRDVVEDQISVLDFFLVPLRKAHATLGFPLYKISRSASGISSGVTCYFEDNVLWLAKTPGQFEPVGLEELEGILKVL